MRFSSRLNRDFIFVLLWLICFRSHFDWCCFHTSCIRSLWNWFTYEALRGFQIFLILKDDYYALRSPFWTNLESHYLNTLISPPRSHSGFETFRNKIRLAVSNRNVSTHPPNQHCLSSKFIVSTQFVPASRRHLLGVTDVTSNEPDFSGITKQTVSNDGEPPIQLTPPIDDGSSIERRLIHFSFISTLPRCRRTNKRLRRGARTDGWIWIFG